MVVHDFDLVGACGAERSKLVGLGYRSHRLMPIEPLQAGHSREFTNVARDQRGLMTSGCGGNQRVVRANRCACGLQINPNTGGLRGAFAVKRQYLHGPEQLR